MKFQLTFKDPDGVYQSLVNALGCCSDHVYNEGESRKLDQNMETMLDAMRPWVEYQEYVTIEIDSETGKASVVPV